MFFVKTLNNISDVIYQSLEACNYTVKPDGEDCEAILVRSADMHSMTLPKNLLAVARAGAGVNNIPIDSCTEQGIVVFNTPGANANAVKELVICGMLLAGRRIVPGIEWLEQTKAQGVSGLEKLVEKAKSQFVGPELSGKRLGVIGLGAIGVMVANAARHGLNMDVVGYDPYMSVDAAWQLTRSVDHAKSLQEIYATCDYITLHLPLNDKTRGMIGKAELAAMKEGTVLLNFARGGLVDVDETLKALDSGHLRNYVTDFPDDVVTGHEKVIAIPHLGASTPESEENCALMAAAQLRAYLEDGTICNSVNLPDCELVRSEGSRLAIINRNVTNMVGQISNVLAASGLNIDHMLNKSRGNWAYTLLDLTTAPDDACIAKLRGIEGVVRVRVL
ncbi:MAG: phosphoglycerate dehydrogenase [Oscillospiraceae bacterium]